MEQTKQELFKIGIIPKGSDCLFFSFEYYGLKLSIREFEDKILLYKDGLLNYVAINNNRLINRLFELRNEN